MMEGKAMAYNTAVEASYDVAMVMNAALDKLPEGITVQFASEAEALKFSGRCHAFRKRDRRENKAIYSKDSPRWGRSWYDLMSIRVRGDSVVINTCEQEIVAIVAADGTPIDLEPYNVRKNNREIEEWRAAKDRWEQENKNRPKEYPPDYQGVPPITGPFGPDDLK